MKPFPEIPLEERPETLRWRCEVIGQDEQLIGVLCGDVKIVLTHWANGRSIPCRAALTGNTLQCFCRGHVTALRPTAYLPLCLKDGDRVVVPVGGRSGRKVREAGSGAVVRITKPPKRFAKLVVTQLPIDAFSATLRSAILAKGPQDIQHFLLHLWQDKELCEHFGFEFKPSEATRSALGE